MATRKEMPELTLFRELLSYDEETGWFTWNERPNSMFAKRQQARTWNSRFSGTRAFNTVNHNGYMYGAYLGSNYSTHRMAWYYVHGENPLEIDHINGDRSDNRLSNLRNVSRQQNCQNTAKGRRNLSGVVGVSWDAFSSTWHARIQGKHLGRFKDFSAAVSARKAAELSNGFHANHGR